MVARQERLRKALFENGVLILFRGRWFISGAITEQDADQALEITDRVIGQV